ncbi:response regulator [Bacteriovoracales bacterium]|nr:response regulator [Bacteriovoracales bacterium]
MKVLLIEDELDVADVYISWLEESGHEITHCANGYTAGVEILEQGEGQVFGLILTDIKMPGKTGIELIDFLDKIETKTMKTPTIFLSGFIDEKLREKYKDLPHVTFLEKPVSKESFVQKVNEVT